MRAQARALAMLLALLPLTACSAGQNSAPQPPEALQRPAPAAPETPSILEAPQIPDTEGPPSGTDDEDESGMVIEPPPIESEAEMTREPPATGTEDDMLRVPPQVEPQPPRRADDSTVQEVQR